MASVLLVFIACYCALFAQGFNILTKYSVDSCGKVCSAINENCATDDKSLCTNV